MWAVKYSTNRVTASVAGGGQDDGRRLIVVDGGRISTGRTVTSSLPVVNDFRVQSSPMYAPICER